MVPINAFESLKDNILPKRCILWRRKIVAKGYRIPSLDYIVIGTGDSGDVAFRGYVLDVKTRSKPSHDLLMVLKRQWIRKKHKYDFHVGCNEIEED